MLFVRVLHPHCSVSEISARDPWGWMTGGLQLNVVVSRISHTHAKEHPASPSIDLNRLPFRCIGDVHSTLAFVGIPLLGFLVSWVTDANILSLLLSSLSPLNALLSPYTDLLSSLVRLLDCAGRAHPLQDSFVQVNVCRPIPSIHFSGQSIRFGRLVGGVWSSSHEPSHQLDILQPRTVRIS